MWKCMNFWKNQSVPQKNGNFLQIGNVVIGKLYCFLSEETQDTSVTILCVIIQDELSLILINF